MEGAVAQLPAEGADLQAGGPSPSAGGRPPSAAAETAALQERLAAAETAMAAAVAQRDSAQHEAAQLRSKVIAVGLNLIYGVLGCVYPTTK